MIRTLCTFVLATVLLWAQPLSAQQQVTVQALLSDGKRYDGKQVVLVGVVRELKEKVSRKGNHYYTFKLAEGDQQVSVFSYGKPTVREGDRVRVTGKFAVEKRVGYATYRNEIDITKGKVEVVTPAAARKSAAPPSGSKP